MRRLLLLLPLVVAACRAAAAQGDATAPTTRRDGSSMNCEISGGQGEGRTWSTSTTARRTRSPSRRARATSRFDLATKTSPCTTASFVGLVDKGFFDGTDLPPDRPGFVIQGGDPTGTGMGGPGYSTVDTPPTDTQIQEGPRRDGEVAERTGRDRRAASSSSSRATASACRRTTRSSVTSPRASTSSRRSGSSATRPTRRALRPRRSRSTRWSSRRADALRSCSRPERRAASARQAAHPARAGPRTRSGELGRTTSSSCSGRTTSRRRRARRPLSRLGARARRVAPLRARGARRRRRGRGRRARRRPELVPGRGRPRARGLARERREVVAATYDGNRGHPVVLARAVWDQIPDQGARALAGAARPVRRPRRAGRRRPAGGSARDALELER